MWQRRGIPAVTTKRALATSQALARTNGRGPMWRRRSASARSAKPPTSRAAVRRVARLSSEIDVWSASVFIVPLRGRFEPSSYDPASRRNSSVARSGARETATRTSGPEPTLRRRATGSSGSGIIEPRPKRRHGPARHSSSSSPCSTTTMASGRPPGSRPSSSPGATRKTRLEKPSGRGSRKSASPAPSSALIGASRAGRRRGRARGT
jgi:hypothetical protein